MDDGELFTIGQMARRTGLAVKTIRFYSDSGLVAPSARSAAGYRLYDAAAYARLDLIRTLRDLGLEFLLAEPIVLGDAGHRDLDPPRGEVGSVGQPGDPGRDLRSL